MSIFSKEHSDSSFIEDGLFEGVLVLVVGLSVLVVGLSVGALLVDGLLVAVGD